MECDDDLSGVNLVGSEGRTSTEGMTKEKVDFDQGYLINHVSTF